MILVAFALLVGCAGAGLAAEPVRIGVLFDLSGPTADAGRPSRLGVMMAADRLNKAGGIKGRPLELVIGDTVGDPAKATLLAGKLIDQDKVAAIIGQAGAGLAVRPPSGRRRSWPARARSRAPGWRCACAWAPGIRRTGGPEEGRTETHRQCRRG